MSNDIDRAAVLAAAEALWHADNADSTPEWRQMAWADMGGSEPTEERVAYELRAEAVLKAARDLIDTEAAAAIGRVEALCQEWETKAGPDSAAWKAYGPQSMGVPFAVAGPFPDLRHAQLNLPARHTNAA